MASLAGKRIIVTGAGRGLGRAYAMAIAAAGGRVLVNDVDAAEARAVCQEILSRGGEAALSSHSVSDPAEAAAMVELCVAALGGLDGLVNNAGLFHVVAPAQEDINRARRLIEVNVLGVMNCGLAAIRKMAAQGHGIIINIASGAALGLPGMSTYGASKGAVISLTRGWALDLKGSGVQVVAVSPVADTRMTPPPGPNVVPGGQPEEIAPLVIYLLDGGAAALHGAVVRLAWGELSILEPAHFGPTLGKRSKWDVTDIAAVLGNRAGPAS
jgi:NAD(P)-dependent dehydrogenase (short-subunit alcohol dehydrogenase family)